MAEITEVRGREITDSRGVPTLEVTVSAGDISECAAVPSGKSTGRYEAAELRDADGRGVSRALALLADEIAPALVGMPVDQRAVDEALIELDGTPRKSRLGGNTMIGVSTAAARVVARSRMLPLWRSIASELRTKPAYPALYMNIVNGGAHADFRLPFQEYMVVVPGTPRAAYDTGCTIFEHLGSLVKERYGETPMGDEGGYSPDLTDLREPFALLQDAAAGHEVHFAIDAAASQLMQDGAYLLRSERMDADSLQVFYRSLVEDGVTSIEDPFDEDDFASFAALTAAVGDRALVVGDDLTVTNPARVGDAVAARAANAMIVKPNQVGTISETYDVIRLAHAAGWKTIISHRSGDTLDSFVADLAVGAGAYGLKAGSPSPKERLVKYERLVEIAEREMVA